MCYKLTTKHNKISINIQFKISNSLNSISKNMNIKYNNWILLTQNIWKLFTNNEL